MDFSKTDLVLYNSQCGLGGATARISPDKSCGTGEPACKININDSTTVTGGCGRFPQRTGLCLGEFLNGPIKFVYGPLRVYYPL